MKYLKNFILLICSLVLALSSWAQSLPDWASMLEMKNVWIGLPIMAGVVLAWLGQSPIKPKN